MLCSHVQPAFMRLSAQAPHSNVIMAADKAGLTKGTWKFLCTTLVSWHILAYLSFIRFFP